MKVTHIFTYNEGPWYSALEAMHLLGQNNIITEKALKATEYEKRRLFAINDIKKTPLDDATFFHILTKSFLTMAKSLVDQYLKWKGNNKNIKSITIINSQGIPKPGYDEMLKELMNINNIPIYHITGMNCASTILALQHLHHLRKKDPLRKEEIDLIFSIEVPSIMMRLKRSILQMPYVHYDGVVSDGAGLVVIESSESSLGLEIVGHRNFLYPKAQENLMSRAIGNQVEHGLTTESIEDIRHVIKDAINYTLSDLNLNMEKINHWILHPGGVKVINTVSKELGLKDETMKYALDTIRSQGNSMSNLILYVLQKYFESNTFSNKDIAMLIGIAPGFEIQTVTVRYC
ncbi:hypothetical protein HY745_00915 [Candidatus Desantisbacteria bacterium]|nr:hypothetical protein [Candidatus Desantisbacteria bacterium]